MQTRKWSLIEALTNVAIGFVISLISQILIFHFKDIKLSIWENLEITAYFTIISIARSYFVRRWFNTLRGEYEKIQGHR